MTGQKAFLKQVAKILKLEGEHVKPEQVITKRDLAAEVKGLMTGSQKGTGYNKRKLPLPLPSATHSPPHGKAIKVFYLYR